MSAAHKNTYTILSDHTRIPNIGLGTLQSLDVKNAVICAIDTGYRHIDCAHVYQNEAEVGEAIMEKIRDGTIDRDDIYITTKLWHTYHRPERVEQGIQMSLGPLQLDYVDLFLMHAPCGMKFVDEQTLSPKNEDGSRAFDDVHYVETWKAMEKLVETGLTISVGVSNFSIKQIEDIVNIAEIPCVMNQVEIHPALDQTPLVDFCRTKKVAVTAFSPFGSPGRSWATDEDPALLESPVVSGIAENHGCTPGQVLLAYHLNQDIVVIPKSATPAKIKENFQALDVKLAEDEISKLRGLNCNFRSRGFRSLKGHPYFPLG